MQLLQQRALSFHVLTDVIRKGVDFAGHSRGRMDEVLQHLGGDEILGHDPLALPLLHQLLPIFLRLYVVDFLVLGTAFLLEIVTDRIIEMHYILDIVRVPELEKETVRIFEGQNARIDRKLGRLDEDRPQEKEEFLVVCFQHLLFGTQLVAKFLQFPKRDERPILEEADLADEVGDVRNRQLVVEVDHAGKILVPLRVDLLERAKPALIAKDDFTCFGFLF